MKSAILHLSDIHCKADNNGILDKLDKLLSCCKDDIRECTATFVITTGDIAFSGNADEYDIALTLYGKLMDYFKKNNIKLIVVPGNHDCNFSAHNIIRDNVIKSIITDDIVIND